MSDNSSYRPQYLAPSYESSWAPLEGDSVSETEPTAVIGTEPTTPIGTEPTESFGQWTPDAPPQQTQSSAPDFFAPGEAAPEPVYGAQSAATAYTDPAPPSAAPAPGQDYRVSDPYALPPHYGAMEPPPYGHYPIQYGGTYQPYGAYPYQHFLPAHPNAGAVLGLGIAGMFIGICAPIAWVMGHKARAEINAGAPYRPDGGLNVGYVLGIVSTVLQAFFWLFYIGIVVLLFGWM